MKNYDKIMQVAEQLAARYPIDQISYSSIAQEAGVHWTTVRRYVGDKQALQQLLSRKQPEQGKLHADTRTRVMDAAIKVFATHGYYGATLEQVAVEAGQTKSVVYWHFTNKNDLYLAICERNLKQQSAALPRQIQSMIQAEDRVKALAAWLQEHLAGCMIMPRGALLFVDFYTSSRNSEDKEKLRRLFEAFYEEITRLFRGLQEQGLIRRDMGADSLALFIQSLLSGLVLSWLMAPGGMKLDLFAHDAARLLWSSLAIP
ncbi:TetR family transcriptional regulator [Paenibacillus sp. SYP-B4298]|uniref:TetR family transcriptional regulator n=1 Tax=Paenibacillus sp. SYP-B4298 TaxID=2996034 RepID=UPI0022DD7E35|nr:TetR family transcriptional regulator [Paenibacillus sp. SYP-B4298]